MPSHQRLRPLKRWRYVGVYGAELMACLALVRIGRARQSFWAVWERDRQRLLERTRLGQGGVTLRPGYVSVREQGLELEVQFEEGAGVEAVSRSGDTYAWTRKQGGVGARVSATIEGRHRAVDARAVIDDTAAYYERHTRWRWSAGVGKATDGRRVAWNLVEGVNDAPSKSERTVWVEGEPFEAPPCRFADDLTAVGGLNFDAEATRTHRENLLVLRSSYRQPFGTFSGELARGIALAEGYGVMEEHDVWW